MKILVGFDGTARVKEVLLKLAAAHAQAFDAEVFIFTSREGGPGLTRLAIEKIEAELKQVKERFAARGIACRIELSIRGFDPAEDLMAFAGEYQADEIIIGVKKRSRVGKLVFGSTAQRVILEAPCPVLSVK